MTGLVTPAATAASRPDLQTYALSAPGAVVRGKAMTVSAAVKNFGGSTAAATYSRAWLSVDGTLGSGDVLLGTLAVKSLGATQSTVVSKVVTIPAATAPRTYYVISCADATKVVVESNEANNCRSRTLVVTTAPDLQTYAVSAPASVRRGSAMTVSAGVKNFGGSIAAATYSRVWLSVDSALGTGDLLLFTVGVKSLASAQSTVVTKSITVPASTTARTYHVISCADATKVVAEASETNNCRSRTIVVTAPDLRTDSLSAPGSIAPGGAASVTSVVKNHGNGAAGASSSQVWLSSDAVADGGDTLLGTTAVSALGAQQSAQVTTSVTVPAETELGTYNLISCADGAKVVAETNDTNNCVHRTLNVGERTVVFPRPANPLDVTYATNAEAAETTFATENAASTVTVTGSDGTTYTLDIPAGAVASAPSDGITVTPLTSVTGSPFDRVLGVDIQPHSLHLLKPATLTIVPADPIAVGDQTGFHVQGDGTDFAMAALADGAPITLPLTHFSAVGVAESTAAQRDAVAARTPQGLQAQREAIVGSLQNERRARELGTSTGTDPGPAMVEYQTAYYQDAVQPTLAAAVADPTSDAALSAISDAISWMRTNELYGLLEDSGLASMHNDARLRIQAILQAGANQACSEHDLEKIKRLFQFARLMQLLGVEGADAAGERAQRCARFEVEFTSHMTSTLDEPDGWTGQGEWTVTTHPVILDARTPSVSNHLLDQTVSHWHADYIRTACNPSRTLTNTWDLSARDDGTVLLQLVLDLNLYGPRPASALGSSLTVGFQLPPVDDGSMVYDGCDGPQTMPFWGAMWDLRYQVFHADELGGPGGRFLEVPIRPAEQNGEVLLDRETTSTKPVTYAFTDEVPDIVTDTTRITLKHKPLL